MRPVFPQALVVHLKEFRRLREVTEVLSRKLDGDRMGHWGRRSERKQEVSSIGSVRGSHWNCSQPLPGPHTGVFSPSFGITYIYLQGLFQEKILSTLTLLCLAVCWAAQE